MRFLDACHCARHLCTETRILTLAHYGPVFGCANAPVFRFPGVYMHGFSVNGKEIETVIESNKLRAARNTPKIYFKYDTTVFGQTLLPPAEGLRCRSFMASFPHMKHFHPGKLQRIEDLALSIEMDSISISLYRTFYYLNLHIGLGRIRKPEWLYLCPETDGFDLGRG